MRSKCYWPNQKEKEKEEEITRGRKISKEKRSDKREMALQRNQ